MEVKSSQMSALGSALIFCSIPLGCDKAAVIYSLQLQQLHLHFKIPSYVSKQTGRNSVCSSFVLLNILLMCMISIPIMFIANSKFFAHLLFSSMHICVLFSLPLLAVLSVHLHKCQNRLFKGVGLNKSC